MMQMKKYFTYSSLLLMVFLLGACTDGGRVKSATADESESELGITSFDLEIDTKDHKEAIEASVEIEGSTIEAEYVNRIEPKKLKGDKAYDELKTKIKDIGLTKDMKKDEVIEKVTKTFDVEDYTKFELEVEFSDGEQKEYKDKKSK